MTLNDTQSAGASTGVDVAPRELAPVLEQRLAGSIIDGYTGELLLDFPAAIRLAYRGSTSMWQHERSATCWFKWLEHRAQA